MVVTMDPYWIQGGMLLASMSVHTPSELSCWSAVVDWIQRMRVLAEMINLGNKRYNRTNNQQRSG